MENTFQTLWEVGNRYFRDHFLNSDELVPLVDFKNRALDIVDKNFGVLLNVFAAVLFGSSMRFWCAAEENSVGIPHDTLVSFAAAPNDAALHTRPRHRDVTDIHCFCTAVSRVARVVPQAMRCSGSLLSLKRVLADPSSHLCVLIGLLPPCLLRCVSMTGGTLPLSPRACIAGRRLNAAASWCSGAVPPCPRLSVLWWCGRHPVYRRCLGSTWPHLSPDFEFENRRVTGRLAAWPSIVVASSTVACLSAYDEDCHYSVYTFNVFMLEENIQNPGKCLFRIKEVEMVDSVDNFFKSSRSIKGTDFSNFEMLDAKIASALNKIIQNSHFKKKVSLEEQKAQKKCRFLRGRQIAFVVYDYFRITGAHDTALHYAYLFSVTLHDDNVQEFDTIWGEVLLSMSKIPSDDVLESLFKLRIRESAQLKTLLESYDMEIHQKISIPNCQKLKTMVNRRKDQKLRLRNFDGRNERIETVESQGLKWY